MAVDISHQSMFGGAIQHPLLPGAVVYTGRCSPWQPVVTSLPPQMTELPKESIIAHTDFTTTSGLAKRRLSSKKRKRLEAHRRSSACDSFLSDGGSPNDSAYGSCPSVTTLTPPGLDRTSDPAPPSQPPLVHSTPLTHSTTSSFHPPIARQSHDLHPPVAHPHSHDPRGPPATMSHLVHNQYPSNPVVMSQLQQELNYRFLAGGGPTSDYPEGSRGVGKWCNAHVTVAKMIQQNQLESQLQNQVSQAQVMEHVSQHQTQSSAAQQQQLAMLQMYPPSAVPAGYMLPPYSGIPVQFVPQVTNSVAIMNPGDHVIPVQIPSSQQYTQPMVVPGGQWVAPMPVVGGNCVINPLQAGILAAPWVK